MKAEKTGTIRLVTGICILLVLTAVCSLEGLSMIRGIHGDASQFYSDDISSQTVSGQAVLSDRADSIRRGEELKKSSVLFTVFTIIGIMISILICDLISDWLGGVSHQAPSTTPNRSKTVDLYISTNA